MAFRRRFGRRFRRRLGHRRMRLHRAPTLRRAVVRAGRAGVHMFKKVINLFYESASSTPVVTNFITSPGTSGVIDTSASGNVKFTMNGGASGVQSYASFGYQFNIQNVPDLIVLAAQHEWWKVNMVVIKIIPYASVADSESIISGQTSPNCFVHWCIDQNNINPPSASEAGIGIVQNYRSYRHARLVGNRPITIRIRPRLCTGIEVAGGSVFPYAQMRERSPWLNTANLAAAYFGIRGVIEGIQPDTVACSIPMRIETSYYCTFKHPR